MAEFTTMGGQTEAPDQAALIEREARAVIDRVGRRVREARARKGLPRRALSDISGVSPRYLAQLESGEGNISIALLMRVAVALDCRIEWLVGAEDPRDSEALQVAEQFRAADPRTRAAVRAALSQRGGDARAQRVCLVGLRGAGKSTLGRKVGAALGAPFVELNHEIEQTGGMPTPEIMALYGQEGYRKLEADALERVIATHERMVLAVAGGIVAEPATYARLLERCHTIWIKASPEEHMARVRAQGDERPMEGQPEAMAQLRAILTSRETLYARAHAQLDTSGAALEASCEALQALIAAQGFLDT